MAITTVSYHRRFIKLFRTRIKRNKQLDSQFTNRLKLFLANPQHPLLRDHALTGAKRGLRAFSINGDIRAVYESISPTEVHFVDIGTHNQVY